MQKMLIIASSLNEMSRSQALAQIAFEFAKDQKLEVDLLDLRQHPLPLAGSDASWDNENVTRIKTQMQQYNKFIFAAPIYNFDINAALKNLLELCAGSYLEGATAGFICTAGGKASYMSALGIMNSLMLDFRVWVAPRYVYATETDWTSKDWRNQKSLKPEMLKRIQNLVLEVWSVQTKPDQNQAKRLNPS